MKSRRFVAALSAAIVALAFAGTAMAAAPLIAFGDPGTVTIEGTPRPSISTRLEASSALSTVACTAGLVRSRTNSSPV